MTQVGGGLGTGFLTETERRQTGEESQKKVPADEVGEHCKNLQTSFGFKQKAQQFSNTSERQQS